MEVTIVQPLTVRMPEGPQALKPGEVIELPDKVAQRLQELAPGKVRLANGSGKIRPGVWCEWWSPLVGHCTGQIKQVAVSGYIVTNHSVLGPEEAVTIPAEWLIGHYRDE